MSYLRQHLRISDYHCFCFPISNKNKLHNFDMFPANAAHIHKNIISNLQCCCYLILQTWSLCSDLMIITTIKTSLNSTFVHMFCMRIMYETVNHSSIIILEFINSRNLNALRRLYYCYHFHVYITSIAEEYCKEPPPRWSVQWWNGG